MFTPSSIEEVAEFVIESDHVVHIGNGTKFPSDSPYPPNLILSELRGILEYEPSEYTITALAGTTLQDINEVLQEHQQYLPFDPPLVETGGTLGGTIACGLSGPGRLRYGGLRDFLIGVRFVDGNGHVLHGGGKVVKNAAGFDYPKFLCGSKGSLGVIVEVTLKVFPQPMDSRTLLLSFKTLDDALNVLIDLTLTSWDPDAIELDPINKQILLRLCGNSDALDARMPAIQKYFSKTASNVQLLSNAEEIWRGLNEFAWRPKNSTLVKIPTTPPEIPSLEAKLSHISAHRRYSMAGNLALVTLSHSDNVSTSEVELFGNLSLNADHVLGPTLSNVLPHTALEAAIHDRIRLTFDPHKKFHSVDPGQ